MDSRIALIITGIAVSVFCWLSYFYQRKTMTKLAQLIYDDKPEAAVKTLAGPLSMIFIPRVTRLLMSLDVYMVTLDRANIEKTFQSLEKSGILGKMNRIGIYNRMLSYYTTIDNREKAEEAYAKFLALANQKKPEKNPHLKSLMTEAEQLIEVYVRENTDYIDKLRELSEAAENDVQKGICYYRIAKLYYFKGDEVQCRKNLKKSRDLVKGSVLENAIDEILQGELDSIAVW